MKKRLLRLSKRILILTLCTTLLSGSVFSKYKITANAAAMALGTGAAYEICVLIAEYFLAAVGACAVGEAIYQNRDKLAEFGKQVIDSCSFEDAPDWVIVKATAAGQQQVFGREVFDYIRAMTLASVLAGGSSPQNNNDDDDDDEPETTPDTNPEENPDVDPESPSDTPTAEELYEARTGELNETALMATGGFLATLATAFAPLIEGIRNDEETILSSYLPGINDEYFDGIDKDAEGNYILRGYFNNANSDPERYKNYYFNTTSSYLPIVYINNINDDGTIALTFTDNRSSNKAYGVSYKCTREELDVYGNWMTKAYSMSGWGVVSVYGFNVPVFGSKESALNYINTGDSSGIINGMPKVYTIADWLQEDWSSALDKLHGGIHSLTANAAIVGEAANLAFQNQLDGKGYIEALDGVVAGTAPLPLPGTLQDPVYIPEDSPAPRLDPSDFPWPSPVPDPTPVPDPSPDPEQPGWDEIIHGKDTFGLNTLFGSLILLIMILIMLLLIFLSCLAFIIMIFRIPAQTGFLPEEMIAGLDYIKTLEIPGFGMSVYAFFMALIYILLIFTVIGILRKNIDKIKFPRKGRRS